MTVPAPEFVVSFRDADQPRALAARYIAVAHRHPRGWTVHLADAGGRIESLTFDAAVSAVLAATRTRRLLIFWPGDAP